MPLWVQLPDPHKESFSPSRERASRDKEDATPVCTLAQTREPLNSQLGETTVADHPPSPSAAESDELDPLATQNKQKPSILERLDAKKSRYRLQSLLLWKR